MDVVRYITFYDNSTKEFAGEFRIDMFIDLEDLKKLFTLYENDPLMYMGYEISFEQAASLKKFFEFEFQFDKYYYHLDCYQADT